jgi:hypothetical protein
MNLAFGNARIGPRQFFRQTNFLLMTMNSSLSGRLESSNDFQQSPYLRHFNGNGGSQDFGATSSSQGLGWHGSVALPCVNIQLHEW